MRSPKRIFGVVGILLTIGCGEALAQVEIMGKVWIPRFPEAAANLPENTGKLESYFGPNVRPDPADIMPMANVRCYASAAGPDREALAFRTWEMAPTGWYRLVGMPGAYTLLYTGPSLFVRPTVLTNVFMQQGDRMDLKVVPPSDYAVFNQGAWDSKATDYFQTFVAKSIGITNVGFRVVHDGVDGEGPGAQNLLVSIHRKGPGTPNTWEQVGPTMVVPDVDSGGAKSYDWSAAWLSGEVPTRPGEVYAVHLRAEKRGNTFQMFWRERASENADCYRTGGKSPDGFVGRQLYMYVAGDGDGLLIPYNKRVQKEFLLPLCGFARKWSQTYVAKGRGLAGVIMYTATSGIQPGIHRQRAVVRIREGGPRGPVVGVEKIAIGNGNFTGDASWGTFGVVYAPGEMPLTPGATYAIEMESIENYESLHGYVNIKNMVSDDRPGFNPYRKHPADPYDAGTAYKNGSEDAGFDLDMQVVEYVHHRPDWSRAVDAVNLVANGDMNAGDLGLWAEPPAPGAARAATDETKPGKVEAWKTFAADPATTHLYIADGDPAESAAPNRFIRVVGAGATNRTADGGFVQRVAGLRHNETYRLGAKVRCSWPIDLERGCMIGYDPTGQDIDPGAATIVWTPAAGLHGIWTTCTSVPIRPRDEAISIWLKGWTRKADGYPFRADFDEITLRRVRTDVPVESD